MRTLDRRPRSAVRGTWLALLAGAALALTSSAATADPPDSPPGLSLRECHEFAVRPVARAWRLARHLQGELDRIEAEIAKAEAAGCIDAERGDELDAELQAISERLSDALLDLDAGEAALAECAELLPVRLAELVAERAAEAREQAVDLGFFSLELQQRIFELDDC